MYNFDITNFDDFIFQNSYFEISEFYKIRNSVQFFSNLFYRF